MSSSSPKPSRNRSKGTTLQNSLPPGTIPAGDETKGPDSETATATATEAAETDMALGGVGSEVDPPTPPAEPVDLSIQALRKTLSDKYPNANAKEVIEQMQVQLSRFPRRVQEAPKRKIQIHVNLTVETVAWFHELMGHAWPSRRSRR